MRRPTVDGRRHRPHFYTSGSTAAARDGAAAVRAFRNGRDAVMTAPGANGRGTVADSFPLAGFGAAYEAICKECPAGGPSDERLTPAWTELTAAERDRDPGQVRALQPAAADPAGWPARTWSASRGRS